MGEEIEAPGSSQETRDTFTYMANNEGKIYKDFKEPFFPSFFVKASNNFSIRHT